MLNKFRTFLILFEFAITVMFVIVLMYIFRNYTRPIRRIWAKTQSFFMRYKIEVEGEIDEDANILLINHQGLVDIIALEALHPKDICWITKKELQKIPILGHVVTAPKMIPIQREDKRSMIGLVKEVKDRLEKDRVITIFPEGTRGDGKKLLKFKKGAKFLVENFNIKVQPVVLCGTKEVLDTQNFSSKSGIVSVKFLPSFTPIKDSDWYEKTYEDMKKELENELAKRAFNS